MSLKKLKMGFKQIYGDTVFGFLFEYKMDYARQLLDSGSYNVNEVGLKIGYSTGSHFIAAFKNSLLWGLGCLFFYPISIVFLILYWQDAKNPFFLQLIGIFIVFLGAMFMSPEQLSTN